MISSDQLGKNAVDSRAIADGAVTATDLAANAISGASAQIDSTGLVAQADGSLIPGVTIYNNSGVTLAAGTLVYVSMYVSTSGLAVALADADSGLVATHVIPVSIANGASGIAVETAIVGSQNTLGRTIGDLMYLSTTAGTYTNTAPSGADQVVQVVGTVKVVSATVGEIEFYPGVRMVTKLSRSQLQNGIITPDKMSQSSSLTATADGTGSGAMNIDTTFYEVTSASAADQVSLPGISNALKGKTFSFYVGANGCELITPASSNATINNVDSDGTNQADIPANSLARCTCISGTAWLLEVIGQNGTVSAAITPDND